MRLQRDQRLLRAHSTPGAVLSALEASSHASATTSQEAGALVDASTTEMRRQKLTDETPPAQDTQEPGRRTEA